MHVVWEAVRETLTASTADSDNFNRTYVEYSSRLGIVRDYGDSVKTECFPGREEERYISRLSIVRQHGEGVWLLCSCEGQS